MSSTVEVGPARKHSRARFLVLIPLLPALAALAMVATVPRSSVNTDLGAQALPLTVAQPAAASVQATPAITAGRCSVGGITVRSVSSSEYSSYEQANFDLINEDRAAAGVGALSWSSGLANTARAWATYLADNSCTGSEIGHSNLWKNGENLYWISGGAGSGLAARANTAFMNSTGHYANLVRPTFSSVGVGIAHGPGGWYVVQNFSN